LHIPSGITHSAQHPVFSLLRRIVHAIRDWACGLASRMLRGVRGAAPHGMLLFSRFCRDFSPFPIIHRTPALAAAPPPAISLSLFQLNSNIQTFTQRHFNYFSLVPIHFHQISRLENISVFMETELLLHIMIHFFQKLIG
jgi:hypothetical protein